MRTGVPRHLSTFNYIGFHRYFLTFCTFERRLLFLERSAIGLVRDQILRASETEAFAISAYCFMPDHLHLLVEGQREDSTALRFISLAKQLSGFHYRQKFGGPLWQRYGYERVLRNDEETLAVARYVIENPLRGGLVSRIEDYPFVGSYTHTVAQILEATTYSAPLSRHPQKSG